MKSTITKSDFTAAFHNMGRGNQFTHKGLCELYDFLTELEDQTGDEQELDVIALCCDFNEDHYTDLMVDMDIDTEHCEDEEEVFQSVLDELEDSTMLVYADEDSGMIMYADY